MPAQILKIPGAALKAKLPVLAVGVHYVRLVLVINGDISIKKVTIEGDTVRKWIPKGGLLYWENPKQVVTGTLDVSLEVHGGPNGAASLITLCDGKKCGTINLTTAATGHAAKEESYVV